MQKVLYDTERGIEYQPLKCMNNDEYAKLCYDSGAKPCIYIINATASLNTDIATSFRKCLSENRIDFLINSNIAREEILNENKDYVSAQDVDTQIEFEKPFIETQMMVSECAELQCEKMPQTGAIRVSERGNARKDRYSSVSYGNYFLDQLELDLLSDTNNKSSLEYYAKNHSNVVNSNHSNFGNGNKTSLYKKIFR